MSYSVTRYIVTVSFGYTQRNSQNFKCPISLRSKPLALMQSIKPSQTSYLKRSARSI